MTRRMSYSRFRPCPTCGHTAAAGGGHPAAKLDADKRAVLRWQHAHGRAIKALAYEWGISRGTAAKIIREGARD